jgi:GTPase SAR1 family protein
MSVIHLAGTFCSGKTTLINTFVNSTLSPIAMWDIKENFHNKHGIIKNGKMDFELYAKKTPLIEDAIYDFIYSNRWRFCIIESSGFNTHVNLALYRFAPVLKEIYLTVPDDLIARCEKREENEETVRKFANKYEQFVNDNRIVTYSEKQAYKALEMARGTFYASKQGPLDPVERSDD